MALLTPVLGDRAEAHVTSIAPLTQPSPVRSTTETVGARLPLGAALPQGDGPAGPGQTSWWRRRVARREALKVRHAAERGAAHRAELHHMAGVLAEAASLVDRGWVQDGWLQVGSGAGARTITTRSLHLVDEQAVTGACLVGAVVQSVGLARISSQLTRRSLDVVWQTVFEVPVRPGRACSPEAHRSRVRDLTRWNDAASRGQADVAGALRRAEGHVLQAVTPR